MDVREGLPSRLSRFATATQCNILQHAATHGNMLHYAIAHYNNQISSHDLEELWDCHTLHFNAVHCITLHHTAAHCNTLQHAATHYTILQHTATHSHQALLI